MLSKRLHFFRHFRWRWFLIFVFSCILVIQRFLCMKTFHHVGIFVVCNHIIILQPCRWLSKTAEPPWFGFLLTGCTLIVFFVAGNYSSAWSSFFLISYIICFISIDVRHVHSADFDGGVIQDCVKSTHITVLNWNPTDLFKFVHFIFE